MTDSEAEQQEELLQWLAEMELAEAAERAESQPEQQPNARPRRRAAAASGQAFAA